VNEQEPHAHGNEHEHELFEPWSRRQFFGVVGAAAGGLLVPSLMWLPSSKDVTRPSLLTGSLPLRLAMHVHGSWSEGLASWEAQFAQAAANGFDVLYMTDHDFRAMADNYLISLSGVTWVSTSTGTFAQKAQTANGGSLRLLSESASATRSASVTMQVQPKPLAFNRLRTSIAGLTIRQTITSARLTYGALYELVVPLSYHPAVAGRVAGNYQLVYRFGGTTGRWVEGGGLIGVVSAPTPAAGSSQTLVPQNDVAALWPGMVAIDNVHYGFSFVARSPKRTAVADIRIASVTMTRSQSSAAAVLANQASVAAAYQPRYPNLGVRISTEISKTLPDMNAFGLPPWEPNYTTLPTDHDTRYREIVDQVHEMHGLISWNHPFGYNTGPLLTAAERVTKRRQVFQSMLAVGAFDVDIIEVGYALRGQVDAATHIALWDTFSRNGTFLTGNGTSDDHGGLGWKSLNNGFATGAWTASKTDTDVTAALAAGRAFAAHVGRWPGGQLDMVVDDTVPMGAVSVSAMTSRRMALSVTSIPTGGSIQLVSGPVDYAAAQDPGTTVVRTLGPSAFVGGVASFAVDTTTSRFYRAQVLASDGSVIGTGNPVWLLRQQPPSGIPAHRAVT
jgi:hypothetical protein